MVRDIYGKFSDLVVVKVDQRVFIAQVHYHSTIWIIDNLKHFIVLVLREPLVALMALLTSLYTVFTTDKQTTNSQHEHCSHVVMEQT